MSLISSRLGVPPAIVLLSLAGACAAASGSAVPVPAPVIEARPAAPPIPAPSTDRLTPLTVLTPALPQAVGMDSTLPPRLDSIMRAGLTEGAAPGASLAVGRYGRLVHLRGYGTLDYTATTQPATPTTLYDLASLTKVVVTTTAAMMLEESGRLDIDRTVASYVPELKAPDKATITVRMLLTHSGGFEAYAPLYQTL